MSVYQAQKTRPAYLIVFLVLAVFTAMEVGVSYLDDLPHAVKVVALVALAATKVSLVLLYFMHLKFDSRVFVLPLALAAVLVIPLIVIITLSPPKMSGGSSSAGAAPAQGDVSGAVQAQSIDVSLTTFAIALSTQTLPAEQVTFKVRNDAQDMPHELTVIKTDLAPDQLPLAGGQVDTSLLEVLGSTDDLAPGQSTTLTVELEPGAYVLVCNIPGHYAAGMYLAVTVGGLGTEDDQSGGEGQPTAAPTPVGGAAGAS